MNSPALAELGVLDSDNAFRFMLTESPTTPRVHMLFLVAIRTFLQFEPVGLAATLAMPECLFTHFCLVVPSHAGLGGVYGLEPAAWG